MPAVEVVPVDSRRLRKQFFHLPWELYAGDPFWVPPIRIVQKELLGFHRHPFHDQAEMRHFLALRDGRPVGRLSAIVNHAHNDWYKERRGFFGFFESIEDEAVSGALFDAARAWFAAQEIEAIRGPVNPSLNYELGLLLDGFQDTPWFMMTYNKPYYARLIEAYGFRKAQDMFAFWGHVSMLEQVTKQIGHLAGSVLDRMNLKCRRMDPRKFDEEIRTFLDIYNKSLVSTWGFVPMSDGEVKKQAAGMKRMIVPELTTIGEIDGKPVGTMFGLLDYNPRIKQIDGKLFPFGFIKLLSNKRAIKRVRLISTNVLPEYQSWGIGLALVSRLVPDAMQWGIEEAEFSWVLESNDLSYKTLKKGGAKINKQYRVYDFGPKDTTANAKFMQQD
ncbi:MAG: GNAT family N-acetyltransferase [Pirellulales bacterium]|nr:GNAT family N-acetyltransferase [Pirellulales bacterium]